MSNWRCPNISNSDSLFGVRLRDLNFLVSSLSSRVEWLFRTFALPHLTGLTGGPDGKPG
jgi:hypothetical protein